MVYLGMLTCLGGVWGGFGLTGFRANNNYHTNCPDQIYSQLTFLGRSPHHSLERHFQRPAIFAFVRTETVLL